MTREELLSALKECLATAPKMTAKHIKAALSETIAFLESPVAVSVESDVPRGAFASVASECADELDQAADLKIGVMDSDSKIHLVNSQRLAAMQSVATRLREYA